MSDLLLYHISPSRSSIALWMLEEVGEPYDVHLLDIKKGENREPAYLAVNPMGKVPAIRHEGVVITEAAAICCYLADRFPKAGLSMPLDQARRGIYLKWLFFGPSCLEPALIDRMLKREGAQRSMVGWGDFDSVVAVLRDAVSRTPYLMGDRFTAADVIIGSGLRWGMMFKGLPELPEFTAYAKRLEERPALKRANAKEAEFGKRAGA
ncbi:MAG: glutathione S-transferase family protein [Hyphomicrobiales bacterium]